MTQRIRAADQQPAHDPKANPAPDSSGWPLATGAQPFTREELLARYRRQRALPVDPFEKTGKPVAPALQSAEAAARQQRQGLSMAQTFAVAAAMAMAAGAGVGMFSGTQSPAPVSPVQLAAGPAPAEAATVLTPAPQLQPLQNTVINKKPVSIATLEVADASGETNSFIPLALHAEPAALGNDILLKISGIPEGAYLTNGKRGDDDLWALTLPELRGLKLVVPQTKEPQLDLAVAAFEPKTGELAAPVKTMTVALSNVIVEPASAPPPSQTATPMPVPPPQSMSLALQSTEATETRAMVLEGDSLLKSGDVRAARKNYEQAWAGGSPAGAFGMARSYDPVVIGGLALKNAKPDRAKALDWYERAATAGYADAADSIVRLRLKR